MDADPRVPERAADDDEFFSDDRTAGRDGAVELPEGGFEQFTFDVDDPTLSRYRGMRYDAYSRDRTSPSFVQDLLASWDALYREPFTGLTADGRPVEGLYELEDDDEDAPGARGAALRVLDTLTDDERTRFCHPLDSREWRAWSNPEFVIHEVGLRLEDLSEASVDAFLALLRASLSSRGYELVLAVMELNGFLGRIVDLPTIMNPRSYWIAVFGDPSGEGPWGWQVFGHHLALNFVAVGGRQVIAPMFLGAEPALSGDGAPSIFEARESFAIALASSLTPAQRSEAVVFPSVLDPSMPEGRLHPADERHVAGAFRDNRVVPYEGVAASALGREQQSMLLALVEDFLVLLPAPQRRATLAEVASHIDETHFSWYGATDGSQPFYFRIHSPVIFAELDHHAGVWLTNRLPARFHVHTLLRLPNGNDYARRYISQWRARHDDAESVNGWPA